MPRFKSQSPPEVLELFSGINIHSSTPVYKQLENLIKFGVASGKLEPNQQLPSVREFAELLDLNPNTVTKAIRDLEIMGIIYTRRGMGIFIAKDALKKVRQKCHEQIVKKMYEVAQEALASGMKNGEVKDLVGVCLESEAGPYGKVPGELLKVGKGRMRGK